MRCHIEQQRTSACPAPISTLRNDRVSSSFINVVKHAKEELNLNKGCDAQWLEATGLDMGGTYGAAESAIRFTAFFTSSLWCALRKRGLDKDIWISAASRAPDALLEWSFRNECSSGTRLFASATARFNNAQSLELRVEERHIGM
jgi:hypothetical protein